MPLPTPNPSALTSAPPMANPDSFTVGAEQTITFDPLTNDSDAGQTGVFLDPMGNTFFQVNSFTQPVDASGNQLGELTLTPGPNGYLIFAYTADDPSLDTGTHTLTFTYTISDENQATSTATVTLTVTGNVIPGETINGSLFHCNTITGGNGNDVLNGGLLSDTINGGGGADTIHGVAGFDSLNGGAGNDKLYGDLGGADTLDGGSGDDTLTGGLIGDNTFVFGFHSGHDVITDFTPGFFVYQTVTVYDKHGHPSHEQQQVFVNEDTIHVSVADWTGFSDLIAHSQQVGTSAVFTSDDGQDTLTLQHTLVTSLHSGDFVFG
ncbi:MAG: hypothetical protein E7812_06315 [Phenylobacterium sp.]|nr:MAG: hypothetical protein E7812_06315 [Phenylobacterium sp.]